MKQENQEISNSIENNAYDQMVFETIAKSAEKVKDLVKAGSKAVKTLASDVFYSCYKMEPKFAEDAEISAPQKGIIEGMMGLPEYRDVREYTQMDDISSALATLRLAPQVIEEYARIQEKQPEPDGDQPDGDQGEEEGQEDPEATQFRIRMRKALKETQQEAEDLHDKLQIFAGQSLGEIKHMPVKERFKLAQQLLELKKFHDIAKLMGRFMNIVHSAVTTNPTHGCDEITDITTGTDFHRLLPNELLKLRRTPNLFMKDLAEGNLLTYQLKGEEKLGNGPIEVCGDISGSMQDGEPSRETWAKAVTLALAALAEKQKRGFAYIAFESDVRMVKVAERGQFLSLKDKMEIASLNADGGGTNFYKPLMKAFQIRKEQPTLRPADIVFITDGEATLSTKQLEEILMLKKQTEVRIHSIAIVDNGNRINTETLEKFSDTMHTVNSLGELGYVNDVVTATASLYSK